MRGWLPVLLLCTVTSPFMAEYGSPQSPTIPEWWIEMSRGRTLRLAVDGLEAQTESSVPNAQLLSELIRADLEFASLFRLIPVEHHNLIKRNSEPPNHYGWESIGADLVVRGTAELKGLKLTAEVYVDAVKEKQTIFGTGYEGNKKSARALAHRIADDFLRHIGYYGVAQTHIAFASDRDGGRAKEIYTMDYDGFNQKRLTWNRSLNLSPAWSADGQELAYISYAKKNPDLVRAVLGEGYQRLLANEKTSIGPEWSPDGKKIAFSSTRDGNAEIYVINPDGSGLKRLTQHPSDEVSPCWSPNGREIAFSSDRTGSPQIYIMDIEGLNQHRLTFEGTYNEQPAWSPSKDFSEIVFTSRIEKRGRFDIAVINLATRQVRHLTAGRGDINESPSWSPNGMHIVFTSNRTGTQQIFSMNRDGSAQRQLTTHGNNSTPAWGPFPLR